MPPGVIDYPKSRRAGFAPGQRVRVRFLGELRRAVFLEDRGPLGHDSTHLYRVAFTGGGLDGREVEIPADRVRLDKRY